MTVQRTEKEEEARNSLPEDLRPVFDQFVSHYRYAATQRHGAPFVSYAVLSDMVKAGWRLAAEPLPEDEDIQKTPTN